MNEVGSVENAQTLLTSGAKEYELGKYPVAKIIFSSVLKFYRTHHGLKHIETVTVLKKLIAVERKLQNFRTVIVLLEELVSVHGDEDLKSFGAMLDLSDVEQLLYNYSEAKKWAEKCLQICQINYNRNSQEVAHVLVNLSHIESVANKPQAEKHLYEAVKTYQNVCGTKDIRYGYAQFNLGIIQMDMGKFEDSKTSFSTAYDVLCEDVNKCNELEIANVLLNLSTVNKLLGDFSKATTNILDALKIYNKKYGEDDYRSIGLLINLSDIELKMKRYEDVKKRLVKVQEVFTKMYGSEHRNTAHVLFNLSKVEMQLNNVKQSKILLESVLKVYRVCYKQENLNTMNVLLNLILCEKSLKNYNRAEELLNEVILVYKTRKSEIDTAEIIFLMSRVKINLGKYTDAETLLEKILPIYEKKYGETSVEMANILLNLSAIKKGLHNFTDAKMVLNQILLKCNLTQVLQADVKINISNIEIENENYLGAKTLVTEAMNIYFQHKKILKHASAKLNLSNIEKNLGNYKLSLEHLGNVLSTYKTQFGSMSIEAAEVMLNLSNVKNDLGEYDKQILNKIVSIFENHYEPNHFETARILLSLSNVESEIGIYIDAKKIFTKILEIDINNGSSDNLDSYTIDKAIPKDIIDIGSSNVNHGLTNIREAERILNAVLTTYINHYGPKHYKTAGVQLSMANVEIALNDHEKAMEHLDAILPIFQNRYGTEHTETTGVYFSMSIAESGLGNYAKAKSYIELVLKTYEKVYGIDNPNHHPLYSIAQFNLAKIECKMNNCEIAKTLLKKILPLYEKCYGVKHFKIAIILLHLYLSYEDSENDKIHIGKRLILFLRENASTFNV